MNLVLEFDDLHFLEPENCLKEIQFLVNKYPSIKLNFFCTPFLRNQKLSDNKIFCSKIKELSNNIEILVHGLTHSIEEFKHVSYDTAKTKLMLAEFIFEDCDIPFKKIFRGPHWGINIETICALKTLGYTAIFNHEDYRHLETSGIKYVYYNWNLKDEFFLEKEELIIAHGHTHNVCGNGIKESMNRITNFIDTYSPEFKFASEV